MFASDELEEFEYPDEDEQDESLDLLPCPECGHEVYDEAEQCPHCGTYITHSTSTIGQGGLWWWVAVGIVVAIALAFALAL